MSSRPIDEWDEPPEHDSLMDQVSVVQPDVAKTEKRQRKANNVDPLLQEIMSYDWSEFDSEGSPSPRHASEPLSLLASDSFVEGTSGVQSEGGSEDLSMGSINAKGGAESIANEVLDNGMMLTAESSVESNATSGSAQASASDAELESASDSLLFATTDAEEGLLVDAELGQSHGSVLHSDAEAEAEVDALAEAEAEEFAGSDASSDAEADARILARSAQQARHQARQQARRDSRVERSIEKLSQEAEEQLDKLRALAEQPVKTELYTLKKRSRCGACGDDNNLMIGYNGNRIFDKASRGTAADTCGKVCAANKECGGFNFVMSMGHCYYRKTTSCQTEEDADRDCYRKRSDNEDDGKDDDEDEDTHKTSAIKMLNLAPREQVQSGRRRQPFVNPMAAPVVGEDEEDIVIAPPAPPPAVDVDIDAESARLAAQPVPVAQLSVALAPVATPDMDRLHLPTDQRKFVWVEPAAQPAKVMNKLPPIAAFDVVGTAAGGEVGPMASRMADMARELARMKDVLGALDPHSSASHEAAVVGDTTKTLPPIGFVKTHRTASSTVANIIHRLGDSRDLTFFLPSGGKGHANGLGWPSRFPGPDAAAFNGAPMHQFDAILNNAVYNDQEMRAYLRPSPFFFTTIRRPAAQLQSAFGAFAPPGMKNAWAERIEWLKNLWVEEDSLAKFSDRAEVVRAQFQNSQAHDLGWYQHVGNTRVFDQDDAAIHEWLGELESRLGLVLLTEHLDEGLVLLGRHLGLGLEDLAHLNLKVGSPQLTPTMEEAEQLEDIEHVDTLLYGHFNRTFWRSWAEAGGDEALAGSLRTLRKLNAELEASCSKQPGFEDGLPCASGAQTDTAAFTEVLKKKQLKQFATAVL